MLFEAKGYRIGIKLYHIGLGIEDIWQINIVAALAQAIILNMHLNVKEVLRVYIRHKLIGRWLPLDFSVRLFEDLDLLLVISLVGQSSFQN